MSKTYIMKTIKILAITLLGTVMFASCSEEKEEHSVSSPSPTTTVESSNEDDGNKLNISIKRDEDGNLSGGVEAEIEE